MSNNAPATQGTSKTLTVVFLVVALVLAVLYGKHKYVAATEKAAAEKKAERAAVAATPVVQVVIPDVVYATTPAEITADYGFNIEADAPIMVQYPGEKPVLFTPGKGCSQLPEPRRSGPKKFWDPKDSTNGHIPFRIYRVGGRC